MLRPWGVTAAAAKSMQWYGLSFLTWSYLSENSHSILSFSNGTFSAQFFEAARDE